MNFQAPNARPRYRALLQLLRAADTVWAASRCFFERWDLSPSQFNVLNLLHLHPGGLSQTELSRHLIMHRSNLTGLVDQLERRKLVRREDVAADRRAYRVLLAPAGRKKLDEILPLYYQGAEGLWEGVAEARVVRIGQDLERVTGRAARVIDELANRRTP